MAIQLYRAGKTHTVNGIECEVCNFGISELQYQLDNGWFKSPGDIGNEDAKEEDKKEVEEAEEETQLNPVRMKAKLAGIDGWDIKRIKTLEGLLDELKD